MTPSHCLPAELTIYTVGELHPLWLAWLQQGAASTPAEVQAAAVEQVDGAGLQLLLSLSNWLAREQRRLQLEQPSPALQQACEALGLPALLAVPSAAAAAPKARRPAPKAKAKTAERKVKVSP